MRIAILGSRGIPARHGGFETFAEGLAVRLVERGHAVTVYCEGRRQGRPRSWRGVRLVYVPVPVGGCARPLLYDLFALLHASLSHRHVYLLGYGAALFGAIPRLLGRRLWINMDGLEWRRTKWSAPARRWFRWMEAMAMRLADRVVFDAHAIRADLIARHGEPRAHATLAYAARPRIGAPDGGHLRELGLVAGGYHLIVCRVEPENHVLELIQGYARSLARAPLVVVADDTLDTGYAVRCRGAGDARVRWIGTVWDRDRLESLRAGALTYLHGHSVGGTNPSLLEAMACGNVCIAHDNPFNREVLGDAGAYFEDAAGVSAAVERFEALPERTRTERGHAGRARIAAHYSWEALVDAYETELLRDGSAAVERTPASKPETASVRSSRPAPDSGGSKEAA